MKRATLMMAVVALLLGGVGQARAEFIITFSESSGNVVANGSGTVDLASITLGTIHAPLQSAGVLPSIADIGTGFRGTTGTANFYTPPNLTGPQSFGPGGETLADLATGPLFSFIGFSTGGLEIDTRIQSGVAFTTSTTWDNKTISGLGLTPGDYTWNWHNGTDADSLEVIVPSATPVPAPPAVVLVGLGAGCVALRRYVGRRATA
jgi:hypothetical protein